MLFTGEYEHSIDAKQRLAVPAELRACMDPDRHGVAFYAVPGPNGAVWLWPERTFEQMAGAMDPTFLPDEELMEFEELLFSQAARLEPDKMGRVRLPERLLRFAGIEQVVVILGVRDRLELRSPADWAQRREERLEKQGEIVLRARRAIQAARRGDAGDGSRA